ncbi:hypothetical protein BURCENBC7_AP4314 [Burkholderia cenocepacia BC7]|nr:hypothetical protein BURCENK562V_C5081 [Burkholderia cenocepacia K56-2Valvano]ERI24767.1 hypothetical protein BURCENBC7_AP4314 [Burkholderia cenocepacia BC7]
MPCVSGAGNRLAAAHGRRDADARDAPRGIAGGRIYLS